VALVRVKLLVATCDGDYAEHLSRIISEHHADIVNVTVCSTAEKLHELLGVQRYDAALLDAELLEGADLCSVHLPLLLQTDEEQRMFRAAESSAGETAQQAGSSSSDRAPCISEPSMISKRVSKYQRVSAIVANLLEQYAKVTSDGPGSDSKRAQITAVWSPAGGVGKTTVALALAMKKASDGNQVMYLNLENFSSVPAYFTGTGKSISALFEMLDAREGNVKMLIRGIRCQDGGVTYLCHPDNFDDMNILSAENVAVLIEACSELTDELIIDLSCICGERERQVFELADRVLIVTDTTSTAQTKLTQFTSQNNVFDRIRAKSSLVNNRGADAGIPLVDTVISLPFVQTADSPTVYKTLSCNSSLL